MSREDGSLANRRNKGCDKLYCIRIAPVTAGGGISREGFPEEALVKVSEERAGISLLSKVHKGVPRWHLGG